MHIHTHIHTYVYTYIYIHITKGMIEASRGGFITTKKLTFFRKNAQPTYHDYREKFEQKAKISQIFMYIKYETGRS
jgi:hypothetical protein